MKKIVIIGAGVAGLTAAIEILRQNKNEYEVIIFEESNCIGGIAKTVNYKGNRMDMGGHRFFSKSEIVNDWWKDILPMQNKKAYDDILLNRKSHLENFGKDPEVEDNVMLYRNRISRILFENKFFDYPISFKIDTFINLGFVNTIICSLSYIKAVLFKREENNLEDFYINRFGKKLYELFFEYYTENLWGRHPRDISADWGMQRVKGVSIKKIISNMFMKLFNKKNSIQNVETSLIEEFKYPKLGPGQMWEEVADRIKKLGGKIYLEEKVNKIIINENNFNKNISIEVLDTFQNKKIIKDIDYIISSMPLKDFIMSINDVEDEIRNIAINLPYRDYITLGVLVKKLKLKNKTKIKTINNIVPDNWIYIQNRNVKLGRIQIYNNWSPYMVKNINDTVWLGLEYFVKEGDMYWNMSEKEFADFAINEMLKLNLIEAKEDVLDFHIEKIKKAYPAYFDSYKNIDKIIDYINKIPNIYCVGRNGQHHYNNMDHSMLTSIKAVDSILNNKNKNEVWNVNTEKIYHEKN